MYRHQHLIEDDFTRPPAASAAEMPVLDRVHLARYTLGNMGLEREVLGLFCADMPARIAAMRTASSDKDWKMATHTLKGSARAVGAWQLAAVCQQAENLGGVANWAACEEAIAVVDAAAQEAVRTVSRSYPPL